MSITNYLKFLEPLQDQLSGFYSTTTLVITLVAILWILNFIFSLILRIFLLGKSIGSFYRAYVHKYLRNLIFRFISFSQRSKSLN